MDYFAIIKQAWQITWRNKFLWFFGFFAAGISGFSFNFSWPTSNGENLSKSQVFLYQRFSDFFARHWLIFLSAAMILLFISFIFFVLNVIAKGALISCVEKIKNGKVTSFKEGFAIGLSKFGKIFGLYFLFGFLISLGGVILFGPTLALFILKMYGRGLILLIFALLIFLPLIFVVTLVNCYALRLIVLRGYGIFKSINLGFELFAKNILPSIITVFLLFAFSLFAGMVIFVAVLLFLVPFLFLAIFGGILGVALGGVFGGVGMEIFLSLPFLLLLFLVSGVVGAIYNTFSSAVWTLTYLELSKKMGL